MAVALVVCSGSVWFSSKEPLYSFIHLCSLSSPSLPASFPPPPSFPHLICLVLFCFVSAWDRISLCRPDLHSLQWSSCLAFFLYYCDSTYVSTLPFKNIWYFMCVGVCLHMCLCIMFMSYGTFLSLERCLLGSSTGPCGCLASSLPLNYIPTSHFDHFKVQSLLTVVFNSHCTFSIFRIFSLV